MSDSTWVNYFLWKCNRHIPSSILYPATVDKCTMCQYPRPFDFLRPNLDGSIPEPPPRQPAPRPTRVEPPIVVMAVRPEPEPDPVIPSSVPPPLPEFVETNEADPEHLPEPVDVPEVADPEPIEIHVDVVHQVMLDHITMDIVVSDSEANTEIRPPESIPPSEPSPTVTGYSVDAPVTTDVLLVDDYQFIQVSWVADPLDPLKRLIPPSPEPPSPPRPFRSEAEAAILAQEDRKAFRATDGNGNGKHLCPGPKCRKVARKGSPYCSKACKNRCHRLRHRACKAVLTELEMSWLSRLLNALEAWDKTQISVLPEGALSVCG